MSAFNGLGLALALTVQDLGASRKLLKFEKTFMRLDERIDGGAKRIKAAFKSLMIGVVAFAAGAATVFAGIKLAGLSGKFTQGLAAIGAVTRASTEELAALRRAAIDAGIETQFSPGQAVEGLQALTMAGQTATESIESLKPVLDLAAGSLGQLGVEGSAKAVIGTLNSYKLGAEEAGAVTDKLLRITQLSNFQTRDFEVGLSKAAAAGAIYKQDLDDVLLTMGLLRNANIDASSASTGYREAVTRLAAESRVQAQVQKLGVDVFEKGTGKMRSTVDIMNEMSVAMQDVTDKERGAIVSKVFGRRGALAFNAVSAATVTIMREGKKVTLEGAEALEHLRHELANSAGTAEEFKDKLLNTFEGQKTLLAGTLQTLGVVIGEPFEAALKPVVKVVVAFLNMILNAVDAIPSPIKTMFAGFLLAAGAIVATIGAVIAAKAIFVLLSLAIAALGISIGALLLPLIKIGAIVALVVTPIYLAFKHNIGGIATIVETAFGKVRLAFDAISQLFSQGGFSGDVLEEFGKAENQGIRGFAIKVFKLGHRIKVMWTEFKVGFMEGMKVLAPAWEFAGEGIKSLIEAIGGIFGSLTPDPDTPVSTFKQIAGGIGAALGAMFSIIGVVVGGIAWLIRAVIGIPKALYYVFAGVSDFFDDVTETIGNAIVGAVKSFITTHLALFDGLVDGIKKFGPKAWDSIKKTILQIKFGVLQYFTPFVQFFHGIFEGIRSVFQRVMVFVLSLLSKLPDTLLPDSIIKLRASLDLGDAPVVPIGTPPLTPLGVSGGGDALVASAGARGQATAQAAQTRALVGANNASVQGPPPPIHITLEADGEKLAKVVHNANRDSADRGFSPVPVF